jgi:aldehyde dehydrogenase (NAD+)
MKKRIVNPVFTIAQREFETYISKISIPTEVSKLLNELGTKKSEYNSKGKNVIIVFTPITGEEIGRIAITTPEEYRQISEQARVASNSWKKTHTTDRSAFATILAQAYENALPNLATLNQLTTGKLLGDARGEENESKDIANKAAGYAAELNSTIIPTKKTGEYVVTSYEPLGVIANIGPYNYPGLISNALHTLPAIAAGNSVIIKPNELNPLLSLAYKAIFWQAAEKFTEKTGLVIPPNLVQYVQGGAEIGALITTDTNVDKVVFTGSSQVGQKVREAVVKHGGRDPLMETGGHNALGISSDIFKNEDALNLAIECVKESYIGDTFGQRCSCLSRLYVPRQYLQKVVDEVLNFNKTVIDFHTGDPRNSNTILGPMMHPNTINVLNQIKDAAAADGATVYGGARIATPQEYEKAHYMEPIIIVENNGQNERLLATEPFGPCMHIIPFDHDHELPTLMNAGKKDGLTSSIFSLDPKLVEEYHLTVKTGNRNVGQKTSGAPVYAAFGPHNGGQVAGQGMDSFKQYMQRVTSIQNQILHLPQTESYPTSVKIANSYEERLIKASSEKQVTAKPTGIISESLAQKLEPEPNKSL